MHLLHSEVLTRKNAEVLWSAMAWQKLMVCRYEWRPLEGCDMAGGTIALETDSLWGLREESRPTAQLPASDTELLLWVNPTAGLGCSHAMEKENRGAFTEQSGPWDMKWRKDIASNCPKASCYIANPRCFMVGGRALPRFGRWLSACSLFYGYCVDLIILWNPSCFQTSARWNAVKAVTWGSLGRRAWLCMTGCLAVLRNLFSVTTKLLPVLRPL